MHKPGADPADMQVSDFLCDFCRREWDGSFPMVEGHQGSLICGDCLTLAYRAAVLAAKDAPGNDGDQEIDEAQAGVAGEAGAANPAGAAAKCALCLEHRAGPRWASPGHPESVVCARCIKQSAGTLAKDKDWGWQRPGP